MFPQGELRRFLIVSAASALAILGVAAAVVFALAYIRKSSQVLAEAKSELTALEAEHVSVGESREALAELEAERALVSSAFIGPSDPLPLIERIESLGREAGVTAELAVNPNEAGDTYALSAAGSFRNVFRFLSALESFDFFVSVGDAEMRRAERPAGARGSGSYVRLTLTFKPIRP